MLALPSLEKSGYIIVDLEVVERLVNLITGSDCRNIHCLQKANGKKSAD